MISRATADENRYSDFVERATTAFRRRIVELVESSSLPDETPEDLGERAGLAAAAASVWSEHVGPFVDTDGVMTLLGGVSKQAVSQRVRAGRLLALRTESGRLVYPLWQFRDGKLLAGLAEVLDTAGYDPQRPASGWTLASWLCTVDAELGGAPRSRLAIGQTDEVLRAAHDVRAELGTDETVAPAAGAA
jgi:hypothetical protein